jgi:hypothetical protein
VTDAFLIIDGGPHGLPHASAYYAKFPHEPSPLGELELSAKNTTVMTNESSLFTLLGALGKAPIGLVVLVCHAYLSGLYMPVAPGGQSAYADTSAFKIIDKGIKAEADVAVIRALPRTSDAERKTVLDRWAAFLNGLQPGMVVGAFTEAQAEAQYLKFLQNMATTLEFKSVQALRQLFDRLLALRRLKLSRLELRACNIGSNPSTMEAVRKFLGVVTLTAPVVGTFFGFVPIDTFIHPVRRRGARGGSAAPSSTGRPELEASASDEKLAEAKTTRGFVPRFRSLAARIGGVSIGHRPGLTFTVKTYFAFVLRIVETEVDFHYRTSAWAKSARNPLTVDAAVVSEFVREFIMTSGTYATGTLPLAALMTPDVKGQPFVLPLEEQYTRLIAQSPPSKAP